MRYVCKGRCDLFTLVRPSCKWARPGPSKIREGHGVGSGGLDLVWNVVRYVCIGRYFFYGLVRVGCFKSAKGPNFEWNFVRYVCEGRCELFTLVRPSCKWARLGSTRVQKGHGGRLIRTRFGV